MATLTTQAFSQFIYDFSGGSQVFDTPFALGVLSPSHVTAFVTGEVDGLGDQIYRPVLYDTDTGTTTVLDSLGTGPLELVIQRTVPKDALYVSFASGADVTRTNIDTTVRYTLMALHETLDGRWSSSAFDALIIAVGKAISAKDAAEVAAGLAEAAAVSAQDGAADVAAFVALSQAWAESATSPDGGPGSKSAKTWAAQAAASAATISGALIGTNNLSDVPLPRKGLLTLRGYKTTATTAGSLSLTPASAFNQRFTGTLAHTAILPDASLLVAGWEYVMDNSSLGTITVTAADTSVLTTIPSGMTAYVRCVVASGTGKASWVAVVVDSFGGIPVGTTIWGSWTTAPVGFLKENGALVSRITFARLFTAIGTTYGVGDGSTTFALPDLRGEFVRSLDDGRGIDTGRGLGSLQLDAFQNFTAGFSSRGVANPVGAFSSAGSGQNPTGSGGTASAVLDFTLNPSTVARTAAETRPRNVALLACIKY